MKHLPNCLNELDLFRDLKDSEKLGLQNRMAHCMEIADAAKRLSSRDLESVKELVDSLELDVGAVLSFPAIDAGVSAYRVHTGWGIGLESKNLRGYFDSEYYSIISSVVESTRGVDEFVAWLNGWGKMIDNQLSRFYRAEQYPDAFARMMALDALLALFLTCAVSFRIFLSDSPS